MKLPSTTTGALLLLICLAPDGSQQQILNMFHISDLHLDSQYSVRGTTGEARCHEMDGVPAGHLGPAGDYSCDPPALLIESAFKYMSKVQPHPDFIVWTGDSNPHWVKGPDFPYIFSNLRNITKVLRKYFPNTVVVPALGNHDTNPPDQYPDYKVNASLNFYAKYIEEGALGDFIQGQSRDTFKNCGFYTFSPNVSYAKMKFVVLNTNLYYANALPLDPVDPCGQLQWLQGQLENTADDEQVFVVAHIPPGFYERDQTRQMFTVNNSNAFNRDYHRIFSNKKWSARISAHFYGHTHTDFFRLFLDAKKKVRGLAFNTPSITPSLYVDGSTSLGVNPGVRLYHYDVSTRVMVDYEQHYLPLNEVNVTATGDDAAAADPVDRRSRNGKFMGDGRSKRDDTDDPTKATTLPPTTIASTYDGDRKNESMSGNFSSPVVAPVTEVSNSSQAEDSLLDGLVKLWRHGYNATEAFNVPDLSLYHMLDVYNEMISSPDGSIFRNFYKHNTVYHELPPKYQNCSRQCHREFTCTIVQFTLEQMDQCLGRETTTTTTATTTAAAPGVLKTTKGNTRKTTVTTTPHGGLLDDGAREQEAALDSAAAPAVSSVPADHSLRGVAIGFSVVMVVAIAIGGLLLYRKVHKNRYRSQEFLLTDSVFRHDGYSQVESPY